MFFATFILNKNENSIIRYRYREGKCKSSTFFSCSDLANVALSNKVDDEVESGEKTGNGSSFVRKTVENGRKSQEIGPHFANFSPYISGGLSDALPPSIAGPTLNTPIVPTVIVRVG